MYKSTQLISLTKLPTILILLLTFQQHVDAQENDSVFQMPLEELMQQQVSSITKKLQKVGDVAAATYVITAEDIAQSGVTNIPEALRLAPGVNVAAINNNRWAVSIRGFNSRATDKLLVLVDGRTIYPAFFPGTIWENNEIPLDLIERIEIMRGPATSIWGNNAVNGVINIITKSAHDTVGAKVNIKAGTEQRLLATGSYGWALDEQTSVRLQASSRNTDDSKAVFEGTSDDNWQSQNLGFRLDKELPQGRLLVQGGAFKTDINDRITAPRFDNTVDIITGARKSDGTHLQVMWEHQSSKGAIHTLQGFAEYMDSDFGVGISKRKTIDFEYQQQNSLFSQHDLIWGAGFRLWSDEAHSTAYLQMDNPQKTSQLASFFIQDDIRLVPDKWIVTLGTRIEKRTDIESVFLPNIRLLWMPNDKNSLWFSLSKASRQPTRAEREAKLVIAPPSSATLFLPVIGEGSKFSKPEDLCAFDIGWRKQWTASISTDLTGFVYRYNDVRSTEIVMPTVFPPTFITLEAGNAINVRSHGIELNTKWQASNDWQFSFNYNWKTIDADYDGSGLFTSYVDSTAKNSASLQLHHQLTHQWGISAFFRYVDSIDIQSPLRSNDTAYHIPSYLTLDLKINYQISPNLNLSITGQNLLQDSHKEFIDDLFATPASEIERSLYIGIEWLYR